MNETNSITIIVVTQIIAALLPTLAAVAAWLQAKSTHTNVNSKLQGFLDTERRQGLRDGREEERSNAAIQQSKRLDTEQERDLVSELMGVLRKFEEKK